MKKIKELLRSPHIQLALVTGFCIILMAYVSKRMLAQPIGYIPLAIPAFIAGIYSALSNRYNDSKICTTWYWIVAVLLSTALIILFHL
jgi:tetrahydromethanopterin S-methyltransferase subunit E